MINLSLTTAQEQALDIDKHTLVEAGAGAGKTMVLVLRYLTILLKNPSVTPDQILAITFTEKAAQEMMQRVSSVLQTTKSTTIKDHQAAQRILSQLHLANIQTIHSFCAKLLRQYPLESELDPNFQVIQEDVRSFY